MSTSVETKESDTEEYHYEKLSWPEINDHVDDNDMILIPVGSTEDHGPHLPLDVDQVIPNAICEAVSSLRDDVLLFPTINQGYLPHHMDFPGGITIQWETYINHIIDIGVSLSHHGFNKILLVNGHGSNHHLLEQATRQITLQNSESQCGLISWWELDEVKEIADEVLDSGPLGTGHAGELETALYLYIKPEEVDLHKARKDIFPPKSEHFYNQGLTGNRPSHASTQVTMVEMYSKLSETGVRGDPTVASSEKGEKVFDAAVEGLDSILEEFASYPVNDIKDHHLQDVDDRDYDPFRAK